MFEGYYGRRRLKTTLAALLGLIILLILSRRHQRPVREFNQILPNSLKTERTAAPPLALVKSPPGVISSIDFVNSPYLVLHSQPSSVIPIMVLSKAPNIEVRDAIRRTWGFPRTYHNDTVRFKIFFIVGTDDFMTQRIHMEQIVFDDIIQVTIPDMYSFSAYKELSVLVWMRSYLPETPCFIKTEDAVIINMKALVSQVLPTIQSIITKKTIIGWFGSEHVIQRGTYQKFVDAVLPKTVNEIAYANSLFYIVTASAADRMIEAMSGVELIEYPGDPFVTGILRHAAGVAVNQMKDLSKAPGDFTYQLANGACKLAFEQNPVLLLCTSSLHTGSIRSMPEYFDAWNVLIGEKQP